MTNGTNPVDTAKLRELAAIYRSLATSENLLIERMGKARAALLEQAADELDEHRRHQLSELDALRSVGTAALAWRALELEVQAEERERCDCGAMDHDPPTTHDFFECAWVKSGAPRRVAEALEALRAAVRQAIIPRNADGPGGRKGPMNTLHTEGVATDLRARIDGLARATERNAAELGALVLYVEQLLQTAKPFQLSLTKQEDGRWRAGVTMPGVDPDHVLGSGQGTTGEEAEARAWHDTFTLFLLGVDEDNEATNPSPYMAALFTREIKSP